jgi:hypothetical protein
MRSPDSYTVYPILVSGLDYYLDCNDAAIKIMHAAGKDKLLHCSLLDISLERQPDEELSAEKGKSLLSKSLKEGSSHFEWLHRNFDGEDFPVDVFHNFCYGTTKDGRNNEVNTDR